MQPDFNLTIIAAAGPTAKIQSWNTSSSRGVSESIFASAIRDAMFESEIEDEENIGEPGMSYHELQITKSYAEMGCLIHDHLKQSYRFHGQHVISFAVQDDEWTKAWRERTGIPLAFFKEKWEELSVLTAQADGFSNQNSSSAHTALFALADVSLSETQTESTEPLTLTMTMPQIYDIVFSLAVGYAKSFPGLDDLSINTAFHTDVRLLLSGKERYENKMDDLLTLGYTLSYRLGCMTIGTYYKNLLGLDYPDCTSCSVEGWTYRLYKQQEATKKLSYKKIKNLISAANIFSAASDGQGDDYDKPEEYLAIALVESQKTWEEVEQATSILKEGESLYFTLRTHQDRLIIK